MTDTNVSGARATGLGTWLPTLAAPAILIGASTAYYTGSMYREQLLANFGLRGLSLHSSIQETMVLGYSALLRFLIPLTVIFIITLCIYYAWRYSKKGKPTKEGFFRKHRPFFAVVRMIYTIAVSAAIGFMAGDASAGSRYRSIQNALNDHCKSCFIYKTDAGQAVGLLVDQDEKFMILALRNGTAILPVGAVKSIVPVNRRLAHSVWLYP